MTTTDGIPRHTVDTGRRFTHLRLNQHPDGGIARLRPHGSLTTEGAHRLAAHYGELGR
ncbi:allantoicase [Streptomyces sp. NBRC 110611]|nr:hypothetical protein [Streptomyces sp. NBRC 110611]GAU67154.1 allantoicase [Streptomyces sp. NBRC 110611]